MAQQSVAHRSVLEPGAPFALGITEAYEIHFPDSPDDNGLASQDPWRPAH